MTEAELPLPDCVIETVPPGDLLLGLVFPVERNSMTLFLPETSARSAVPFGDLSEKRKLPLQCTVAP